MSLVLQRLRNEFYINRGAQSSFISTHLRKKTDPLTLKTAEVLLTKNKQDHVHKTNPLYAPQEKGSVPRRGTIHRSSLRLARSRNRNSGPDETLECLPISSKRKRNPQHKTQNNSSSNNNSNQKNIASNTNNAKTNPTHTRARSWTLSENSLTHIPTS